MTAIPAKAEVELLTASWCKRCKEIKPVVQQTCALTGASYREIDYDALEDDNPVKTAVTALPTVRVRLTADVAVGDRGWQTFVPAELEKWRDFMMNRVAFAGLAATDMDF
jgi:hypothetical protein